MEDTFDEEEGIPFTPSSDEIERRKQESPIPDDQKDNFLIWLYSQLDKIKKDLIYSFQGKEYVPLIDKNGERYYDYIEVKGKEPRMNEKGIQYLENFFATYFNVSLVMGNLTKGEVIAICVRAHKVLAVDLCLKKIKEFKIKQSDTRSLIEQIVTTLEILLSRAKYGGERGSFLQKVFQQQIRTINQERPRKKMLGGLFG